MGRITGMVDILPHAAVSPRPRVGLWAGGRSSAHLLIHELPGVFLDVAFVEVGGHTHEPNLRQAEVSELDVAKRGDEQAVGRWVGCSGLGGTWLLLPSPHHELRPIQGGSTPPRIRTHVLCLITLRKQRFLGNITNLADISVRLPGASGITVEHLLYTLLCKN